MEYDMSNNKKFFTLKSYRCNNFETITAIAVIGRAATVYVARKTGTAEIKASKEDTSCTE